MITSLKVLAIIWGCSIIVLAIIFLYYKITGQPIFMDVDEDID